MSRQLEELSCLLLTGDPCRSDDPISFDPDELPDPVKAFLEKSELDKYMGRATALHKRATEPYHPDGVEIRSYEDGAYFRNFYEGGVLRKAEYHDKGKIETLHYNADGEQID